MASLQDLVDTVGTLLLLITVIVLIHEVRLTRSSTAYKLYQRLSDSYSDLLWKAVEDPTLNDVWVPMSERRKKDLDLAQDRRRWGAWYALSPEEKKLYRYTRAALEILEQAHDGYKRKWFRGETWGKFQDWCELWKATRFFDYVVQDSGSRLHPSFMSFLGVQLRPVPGRAEPPQGP